MVLSVRHYFNVLCKCHTPAFPGSYTESIGHWADKDLPITLLSAPVNVGESINDTGYFIVIYRDHEHFFRKKSQFNFLLNRNKVFGIIAITDYTTLLHEVYADIPPYSALRIRCQDCSSLFSPPDDMGKCDPFDTNGFKDTLCCFYIICPDNCNDFFHTYLLSFYFSPVLTVWDSSTLVTKILPSAGFPAAG